MLQASVCDGCSLDAFSLGEDYLGPTEVDVGRSEIVDAIVITDVVITLDERVDLPFEIARQVVVVEQNAVLQGLVHSAGFRSAPACFLRRGLGGYRVR
jgi:hypothetical protein